MLERMGLERESAFLRGYPLDRDFDQLPDIAVPVIPACEQNIFDLVTASGLSAYSWKGRGLVPIGYLNGMALTFARVYCKFLSGDYFVSLMAKAPKPKKGRIDALAYLRKKFKGARMPNITDGADTLRHLFVLLLGIGVRESEGIFCAPRHFKHKNKSEDEAGLFQMSYSIGVGNIDRIEINQFYKSLLNLPYSGYLPAFSNGVKCGSFPLTDTSGGAAGEFRNFCLTQPALCAELAALCCRFRRESWGPVNEATVELLPAVDSLLLSVQASVDAEKSCSCFLPPNWIPSAAPIDAALPSTGMRRQ
jgi:hypothetical protein